MLVYTNFPKCSIDTKQTLRKRTARFNECENGLIFLAKYDLQTCWQSMSVDISDILYDDNIILNYDV